MSSIHTKSVVDTAGNESALTSDLRGIPRKGINERSVSFDGSYDYINCGNDESLNIQDNLTVQGWIYYDGGGSQHPRFFGKKFDGTDTWNIGLYNQQNIYYETNCVSGNCPGTNTGIPFPQNSWHHVAWTFSGTTGEVIVYLDGVNVYTSDSYSGEQLKSTSSIVTIGTIHPVEDWFSGMIDEVSIWKRVLTQEELSLIHI